MENTYKSARNGAFSVIGWKSYNQIKKKAMEQEFSWSGLVICLSIAFFIVLGSAQVLNFTYQSLESKKPADQVQKIYYLEQSEGLSEQVSERIEIIYLTRSA